MHGSNSNQANGTTGSAQTQLEQQEYAQKVAEIEAQLAEHQNYLKNGLPESSPIKIPQNAKIKEEPKDGYDQVKYTWEHEPYQYESRWHTRTPNAPIEQGDSWVVKRTIPGIGSGPNARKRKSEILVGKSDSGQNIWVDSKVWNAAVRARRDGTYTQE